MSKVSFSKFTKWLVSASALFCVLLLAGCSKLGTIEVKNDSGDEIYVYASPSGTLFDDSDDWEEEVSKGGKVSKDVEPGDWTIGVFVGDVDDDYDVKTVSVKKRKTVKLTYGKDGKLK